MNDVPLTYSIATMRERRGKKKNIIFSYYSLRTLRSQLEELMCLCERKHEYMFYH